MRLSGILRRGLPIVPARAGIPPTWDRPDPPATKRTPPNRRLTVEEKHFSFFDASSPTYMLVNSEVAEGDIGEIFPVFLRNAALFLLAGAIVGALNFFWSNRPKVYLPANLLIEADQLEREKNSSESKYGLKDLQNNPWKLNVWPESFPIRNQGIQDKAASYEERSHSVNLVRQINKEAFAYWTRIKAEAEEAVKHGHTGHH